MKVEIKHAIEGIPEKSCNGGGYPAVRGTLFGVFPFCSYPCGDYGPAWEIYDREGRIIACQLVGGGRRGDFRSPVVRAFIKKGLHHQSVVWDLAYDFFQGTRVHEF